MLVAILVRMLAANDGEGEGDVSRKLEAVKVRAPDGAETIGRHDQQIGRDVVAAPLEEKRVDEGETVAPLGAPHAKHVAGGDEPRQVWDLPSTLQEPRDSIGVGRARVERELRRDDLAPAAIV